MQHHPSALTQWMKTLLGVGSEQRYTVPSIRRHLTGGRMRWCRIGTTGGRRQRRHHFNYRSVWPL